MLQPRARRWPHALRGRAPPDPPPPASILRPTSAHLHFGVARLVRDKRTKELAAVKYIQRGNKIDENVQREIINHRALRHPTIIRFKEVCLTPTHLAIVMEYAAGGELFQRICTSGRFSEDEARYFFQQLLSGVSYCHSMEICHRDLKLENTLLDGSPTPQVKICDFGYSKSALLHSKPKSTVGTPAYIAPEVLSRKEYDGKVADVWSCGVTLYVMLIGVPFRGPRGSEKLPQNNKQNSWRAILHSRLHQGLFRLQTPPVPNIHSRSFKEDHNPGDQEAALVPEEPAEGDRGEGQTQLHGAGARDEGRECGC